MSGYPSTAKMLVETLPIKKGVESPDTCHCLQYRKHSGHFFAWLNHGWGLRIQLAEGDSGIVGFSCFGPPRDKEFDKRHGELSAIYLLEKFQGMGIGFELLQMGFVELVKQGLEQGYCWVLANNPTIHFYESTGTTANGITKEVELGGQKATELAYVWKNLKTFSDDGGVL